MGIVNYSYNRSTSGGEIIRELVNSTDGQGLHFDGAGSIDFTPVDLGTKFSMEFIVQADSWTASTYKYLVDFGLASDPASKRFTFGSDNSAASNLKVRYGATWVDLGVKVLDDLKVHHLVVTVDGSDVVLYDNGNQVAEIDDFGTHGIDDCDVAGIASNYTNTGDFFNGTLYRTRFFNRTLSSAEVTASFENSTVPFADQYGSQTELTTNGSFASDSDWTKETGWTIAGGKAVATNVPNNQSLSQAVSLTAGKRYQIVFEISGYDKGAVKLHDIVGHTSPEYNENGTHTFEFVANAGSNFVNFRGVSTPPATTTLDIESVTCREVGVVSDYDLAFAQPEISRMVQDRAGAADGTKKPDSAGGVTQVTPIEQLNSKSARIGTSAATPADGDLLVSGNVGVGVAAPQAITDLVEIYPDSGSAVEGLQLLIRGGQADLNPVGDSIGIGFGYGNATDYIKSGIISEFTSTTALAKLHLCTTATAGAATVTKSDAKLTIDSAGLATFSAGIVTSEKGVISGSVEIEDDAVTTITPARKGGFLMLSTDRNSGAGGLPQPARSAQIYFDCGSSLAITDTTTTGIGADVDLSTSDVTGTTGTDGKITVAVQTDVIKIENRMGETNYFHYTIIC